MIFLVEILSLRIFYSFFLNLHKNISIPRTNVNNTKRLDSIAILLNPPFLFRPISYSINHSNARSVSHIHFPAYPHAPFLPPSHIPIFDPNPRAILFYFLSKKCTHYRNYISPLKRDKRIYYFRDDFFSLFFFFLPDDHDPDLYNAIRPGSVVF